MNSHKFSKMRCINCGQLGHPSRMCSEPKTSCGIIAFHIDDMKQQTCDKIIEYFEHLHTIGENPEIICRNENALAKFALLKQNIKMFLVMRKHTIGYCEFVRGRYNILNYNQLKYLFEQMTPYERGIILEHANDFDFLWIHMWTPCQLPQNSHGDATSTPPSQCAHVSVINVSQPEYASSKQNFETLRDRQILNLYEIIKNTHPTYDSPEWGIPKGRRTRNETNIECAIREFIEETGYAQNELTIFDKVHPLIEDIVGTDGIRYRYIYYVALLHSDRNPSISNLKKSQLCEIGDVGLFTIDEMLQKIRPHHTNRKQIILSLCSNIVKFMIDYDD